MESVLGLLGGKPSRVRGRILKSNGIRTRYYAIDPETGRATSTNAELTAEAIRSAAKAAGRELDGLDCIACGTSSPDQLIPNHALMVHGELAVRPCEVVATAGVCLSGLTAMKYAAMDVASGGARAAVATGSELSSSVLRASHYPGAEPDEAELERTPSLQFGQDFLRWMLSDGAGAVWIEREPSSTGLSLRIEWIDVVSFASELETCMYWGAEKREDGSLEGWRAASSLERAVERGMLNVTQDARLLGNEISRRTISEGFSHVRERHPVEASDIDWLLPHYSSEFFRPEVGARFDEIDFHIPEERWFTNLTTCGNTGSASIYIMLEELVRSGRLRTGQKILCFVPESARFSVGYALLTVVEG
jgi:3-oxoacyl-[acyl-carrier-protein] synthase-3